MPSQELNRSNIDIKGYSIQPEIYSEKEIESICNVISKFLEASKFKDNISQVFAIRQLLLVLPELKYLIINKKLSLIFNELLGKNYFLTKAIYFDKPQGSNWFVAYHQDLSISVNKKADLQNYINWTFKSGQYGVQPPINILNDTLTIRIHLDDTDEHNGALKVIPQSHLKGILRQNSQAWDINDEVLCKVPKGGVMLMKPLTLHASSRAIDGNRRRVIHLEFNKHELDPPLKWLEKLEIF